MQLIQKSGLFWQGRFQCPQTRPAPSRRAFAASQAAHSPPLWLRPLLPIWSIKLSDRLGSYGPWSAAPSKSQLSSVAGSPRCDRMTLNPGSTTRVFHEFFKSTYQKRKTVGRTSNEGSKKGAQVAQLLGNKFRALF